MSATTLTIDEWQILFHETVAALLRAKEAVKQQFGLWGLLNGLWRCRHNLKALSATLKALSEAPDGVLSDEFIKAQIPQLQNLLRSIEDLLDTGKRKGLTNRSLTSGVFCSIAAQGEYIAEYLDSLEMAIDPEVLAAIAEGRSQIERGEFETMERLF